ncbi:hypothetical protein QYM36_004558 [Artemia franciscana]|uniref:Glucose-6-phosphatase n=2 Tax=Artemia franciscana TaxID=6661 RepID=A0AA88IHD5_ARTSF|nr:hypothetical protein QYM36_004558 [Artemia franciscana]
MYQVSVGLISTLQNIFPGGEEFFVGVSKFADPKYVFTVHFPILFSLHWVIGVQLLGTVIVAEWSNQILKWLMKGERPYWWVHETKSYNATLPPEIIQFSSTCETGPGTPSGHSMVMSAVWYVIVNSVIQKVVRQSNRLTSFQKDFVSNSLWTIYGMFMMLVALSRMYIAAHFLHQCVLGVALGIIVARTVCGSSKWINMSRSSWYGASAIVLFSALSTYVCLLAVGGDPAWSIRRAVRWCAKREYIHVDTTPFYSLARYSGATLGLGLGVTSSAMKKIDRSKFNMKATIGLIFLCFLAGKMTEVAHVLIPKEIDIVFYTLEFLLNAALPYVVISSVPYFIHLGVANKSKRS